jgi:hypothetical protein
MSETIVKNIEPISRLKEFINEQPLFVRGLPYSGKSIGIKTSAQEPKYAQTIDDLKNFSKAFKMHVELPKDLTKDNISDWKASLRNLLQLNKNIILEGRNYVAECLLGDEQLLHINLEKNIVRQIFSHILTLKRTYIEGLQTYVFRLNRNDAIRYLEYRGLNSDLHSDILEYSTVTISKEQAYIPLLMDR